MRRFSGCDFFELDATSHTDSKIYTNLPFAHTYSVSAFLMSASWMPISSLGFSPVALAILQI